MLGKMKQMGHHEKAASSCDTVVGAGSRMKGEITCKGPSQIAGHLDGDLVGDDRIIIAQSAFVTGQISAQDISIHGRIDGTINATARIILHESAVVEGELNSPSVVIEEGAVFNGKSNMPVQPHKDEDDSSPTNILTLDPKPDAKQAEAG